MSLSSGGNIHLLQFNHEEKHRHLLLSGILLSSAQAEKLYLLLTKYYRSVGSIFLLLRAPVPCGSLLRPHPPRPLLVLICITSLTAVRGSHLPHLLLPGPPAIAQMHPAAQLGLLPGKPARRLAVQQPQQDDFVLCRVRAVGEVGASAVSAQALRERKKNSARALFVAPTDSLVPIVHKWHVKNKSRCTPRGRHLRRSWCPVDWLPRLLYHRWWRSRKNSGHKGRNRDNRSRC